MVSNPSDIKKFNENELIQLSSEIREFILESVSKTGGHLSSNLGTVELTVALHYIFNSPKDQFLWDVGHQAYTHKILTGRKDSFDSLRKLDGLSGFLKRSESVHDVMEAGHSSTSISTALGISKANELNSNSNYIIPIIGDGALTAGLAYEAVNYAGNFNGKLLIVLNDNEMSISNNVGNISKQLSKIRTFRSYTVPKKYISKKLNKSKVGKKVYKHLSKIKNSLKELIIPGMLFEHFGLSYIGPVDGHDINDLIEHINIAKNVDNPVLLHVVTKKGKGYLPAENNPDLYHGVNPFDLKKGIINNKEKTFSNVFGEKLVELASKDSKIIAITAAMESGTGLSDFRKKFQNRFIDVGIAEQNAVTMGAGLAIGGYKPYVAIYSTFLQRGFDQIIHDVALQNLNVVFCIDRSGLVGRDGETHQGIYDTSYLNLIPNMTIVSPKDANELEYFLEMSKDFKGPIAIKYFRDYAYYINENSDNLMSPELIKKGNDILIITSGRLVKEALEAVNDKDVGVLNLRVIKPLDFDCILNYVKEYSKVLILEENIEIGSYTLIIENAILKNYKDVIVRTVNLPNKFIEQGSIKELLNRYELDAGNILKTVTKLERM